MKKTATLLLILTLALSTAALAAKSGQVVGTVQSTNIKCTIGGKEIPAYNILGYMAVIVDDLSGYGFDIAWDGTERRLNIKRNLDSTGTLNPDSHKGYSPNVLATNIKAFIGNNAIPTYNLGSCTAVFVESLGAFGNLKWDEKLRRLSLTLSLSLEPTSIPHINLADLPTCYAFDLTDDQIRSAIFDGEKGKDNFYGKVMTKYLLKPTRAENENMMAVLATPYLNVALKKLSDKNLTWGNATAGVEFSRMLNITNIYLYLYKSTESEYKKYNLTLKQGDKTFEPLYILNSMESGFDTANQMGYLGRMFPLDGIDAYAPIVLVVDNGIVRNEFTFILANYK